MDLLQMVTSTGEYELSCRQEGLQLEARGRHFGV